MVSTQFCYCVLKMLVKLMNKFVKNTILMERLFLHTIRLQARHIHEDCASSSSGESEQIVDKEYALAKFLNVMKEFDSTPYVFI